MLNAMSWGRDRDRVCRIELPYLRPADVLAALQHAVHPRTFDSSERFKPLLDLRDFHQAFDGNRFRFRCGIGTTVFVRFDVDGEVTASASGGTTLRMSIRVAHIWLYYLSGALLLAWFSFFALSTPHGIGFLALAFWAFLICSWPEHVRRYREELEVRLRELGPFLRSRIAPY